jgi:hypothetical protein
MKFRNRLCLFTLIMTSLIAMSLITASCRDTRQAAGSEKKSSSGGGVLALLGGKSDGACGLDTGSAPESDAVVQVRA